MKTAFISEKAKSRFNLNFILSPITALVLMVVAETVGYFAFMPLFFIFIDNAFVTLSLELFAFAFISLAIILWARFVEKSSWLGLGFTKKWAGKDFLLGWGIGAAMLTTCTLIMWGLGAIEFTSIQFSIKLLGEFIILILAWSTQGTTEEILTRGWMFSSLSARHNIPVGILISSLFFTFLHLGNHAISLIPLLDLTLFGVLTCLLMLKTGNIWTIGGLHAAWNCFQGNVFAFPVSGTQAGQAFIQVGITGPEWLSGGDFGVEGSVISLFVQSGMIAWLVYDLYYKHKRKSL
ncbi:CPBP family intramembrane glutamic endopeptidase [Streptococcus parasuis]|uniref:CPBP family intramembrane glutamic endopeptidase n=1 Tax=Streptococcus parasuis TaxID=1501662 RepID=UPI00406360E1